MTPAIVSNYAPYFRLGDRYFFYGDVLEWGLTLALLVITLVLVARRVAWRRAPATPPA